MLKGCQRVVSEGCVNQSEWKCVQVICLYLFYGNSSNHLQIFQTHHLDVFGARLGNFTSPYHTGTQGHKYKLKIQGEVRIGYDRLGKVNFNDNE